MYVVWDPLNGRKIAIALSMPTVLRQHLYKVTVCCDIGEACLWPWCEDIL